MQTPHPDEPRTDDAPTNRDDPHRQRFIDLLIQAGQEVLTARHKAAESTQPTNTEAA